MLFVSVKTQLQVFVLLFIRNQLQEFRVATFKIARDINNMSCHDSKLIHIHLINIQIFPNDKIS